MNQAIIGARGDMAKNLLVPLLQQLSEVIAVTRQSDAATWNAAFSADVIWLCIPREEIPPMLAGKTLRPDQLVIDICSIKRRLSEAVLPTGAAHLSLHPMHGPTVPLNGQKWAIIDGNWKDNNNAETVLKFLKDQGISFLNASSEDEHDFMIGTVLSMPELLTVAVDQLVKTYSEKNNITTPSMEKLMEWAVPASNSLFSFYIHSINSSAEWLRKDLILGAYDDLLGCAKAVFAELSGLTPEQIERHVERQKRAIEKLPKLERQRARQWIERWFVDSNQKIFSYNQKKSVKPKLTIQDRAEDAQTIFPTQQGKVTVGIHGIAGSFTHESTLRLCEELGIDEHQLDIKYLVEAENVVKAVVHGEVDRGVFAMANSGSGAYVSSMHVMGQYTFDVLAIYGMEILQCLIARPEVTSVEQITEVFGHPQAVSQCKRTFAEKYPDIALKPGLDSDDTALCVKRIADGEFPSTTATLASQQAAKIYNVNIVEYGMHHDPFNTTTFLVIKKKP